MKIHPFTYLYLLLAMIVRSSNYILFLIFSILHEIGHYVVALYFSFDIKNMLILPFGAFLALQDLGKHYVYEEMIMLFCGPLVNVVCFIICFFFKQEELCMINLYIFLFNLLPIYPLDGSKILLLILSYIFEYQKCMKIQIKVSLFFICVLWFYTNQIGRKIVLGYLLYEAILYIKNYKIIYMKTILNDELDKNKIKINKKLVYYRPYQNIYEFNQKLYDFDTMKIYLIKSTKSH